MKKLTIGCAAVAALMCAPAVSAKTEATDSLVQNYMRSSLYTIILNSESMNKYFEEETINGEAAKNANESTAMIKSLANTDQKKAANETESGSIFALPAKVFPTIEIPNQFNDHNLAWRVVNFDSIKATVTDAEKAQYAPVKKKSGFGAFAKMAKQAAGLSTQGNELNEDFDAYVPAVMHKFFKNNNVGERLIAKWYDYNPSGEKMWDIATITERGVYNFTPEDVKRAEEDENLKRKIDQTGVDMISNTFVMAVNLRFRSYAAIQAEIEKAAGGNFGALSTIASAAAGDGYTVQAISNLYRLKWSNDLETQLAENIINKGGTIDDLIKAGICELEFVGREKSSANIRQSMLSDKPISSLVKRATARAIDEAIIKLQNSHEEFRTVLPILGGDGENIYAAVGTKEGLNEKDEYEILEPNEDANGHRTYKAVGTVKAVKGKIMNNAYGAEEDLADPKISDEEKEAINRKYSEFKGKKGDYTGFFLRLKKKK